MIERFEEEEEARQRCGREQARRRAGSGGRQCGCREAEEPCYSSMAGGKFLQCQPLPDR